MISANNATWQATIGQNRRLEPRGEPWPYLEYWVHFRGQDGTNLTVNVATLESAKALVSALLGDASTQERERGMVAV